MKQLKFNITLVALVVLSFSGLRCTKLDTKVYSQIVNENFWQTPEQIAAGKSPAYAALQGLGGNSGIYWENEISSDRHDTEGSHTLVPGRVYKQWEESHVENDSLGVEQGDNQRLREVVSGLDLQNGAIARFRYQHLDAQPGQINRAHPLHRVKSRWIRRHDGRHSGDGRPHQHLVASDHTERRTDAAGDATLAGRGDQRQVAGAGNQQKNDDGDDKRAVVGHANERSRHKKPRKVER